MIKLLAYSFIFTSISFTGVPSLSFIDFMIGSLLICYWFFYSIKVGKLKPFVLIPLPFLCMLLLSVRIDMIDFVKVIQIGVIWIASFITIQILFDKQSLEGVFYCFLFGLIVNIIAALLGYDSYWLYGNIGRNVTFEMATLRPSAMVGNPNVFALLAIGTFVCYLCVSKFNSLILLLLSCLCIYTAAVTASRKALFVLPLLIFFSIWLNNEKKNLFDKFIVRIVFPFLIFSGITFLIYFSSELLMLQRIVGMSTDSSFDERSILIKEGVSGILINPILGYGLGWFALNSSRNLYSHVNIIELWLSGGFFLVISYYQMFIRVVFLAYSKKVYISILSVLIILALELAMVSFDQNIIPLLLGTLLIKLYYPSNRSKG